MKIDPSKKYKTKDGREVVNLVRVPENIEAVYPWTGFVEGEWQTWTDDGEYFAGGGGDGDGKFDLIEVREPREWEIVVATPANTLNKAGTIDGKATQLLQGGDKDIPYEFWETVRVREVLD